MRINIPICINCSSTYLFSMHIYTYYCSHLMVVNLQILKFSTMAGALQILKFYTIPMNRQIHHNCMYYILSLRNYVFYNIEKSYNFYSYIDVMLIFSKNTSKTLVFLRKLTVLKSIYILFICL